MTDERYNGQFYAKGNDMVVADLEAVRASCWPRRTSPTPTPHCWRCKHPIIYRATEQWFCSVDAIKDAAVKSCDGIQWKPEWGKDRMTSMITERNDWCISRQRVWGVPIPIFYCEKCGKDIVTPGDHLSGSPTSSGSTAATCGLTKTADELVPEGFVCPVCGHNHFTKESDIMDVWFDSGSTHAAVLDERPYLHFPADVYLEGGDQYRGWFQSSMLTSIANGVAPLQADHHPRLDRGRRGQGHAQEPGQRRSPDEVIKDYGADMLRLWVASADYTQDMRISKDIMKQLSRGVSENPQHRPVYAGQPQRL